MITHDFKGKLFIFRDLTWEEDSLVEGSISTLSLALVSIDGREVTEEQATTLLNRLPTKALEGLWVKYNLNRPKMRDIQILEAPWKAPEQVEWSATPFNNDEEGVDDESF